MKHLVIPTIFFILLIVISAKSQIASGGDFVLQKSVTAGGGEKSSSGAFLVENTGGQSIAGQPVTNGSYTIYAGFWMPEFLAPTAATAEIGGRVLTANGQGIRNAIVRLINLQGEALTTTTGNLGYYRFDEVEVGSTYILSVSSKRFSFTPSITVISVNDSRNDMDFTADIQ